MNPLPAAQKKTKSSKKEKKRLVAQKSGVVSSPNKPTGLFIPQIAEVVMQSPTPDPDMMEVGFSVDSFGGFSTPPKRHVARIQSPPSSHPCGHPSIVSEHFQSPRPGRCLYRYLFSSIQNTKQPPS